MRSVLVQERISGLQRKPADRHRHIDGSGAQLRIVGVEHQQARRWPRVGTPVADDLRDGQFHPCQISDAVHAVFAEMIGADVGDHGHIGLLQRQSAPQQATARGFEHGGVDIAPAQHGARADRAGIIAAVQAVPFDEQAIGAAVAHASANGTLHRGDQAHRGGFAIGAGDHSGGHAAQSVPVRLRCGSQFGKRDIDATLATAQTQQILAQQHRDTMARGGIQPGFQRRNGLVGGQRRQRVLRQFNIPGCRMAGRMTDIAFAGRAPGPFVDFGGTQQPVRRRRESQTGAAGMGPCDQRAVIRPAQRGTHPRDVRTPALQHRRINSDADAFQRRAGDCEIRIGAGQAAGIVEGKHGMAAHWMMADFLTPAVAWREAA